jgi:hypothetical protein
VAEYQYWGLKVAIVCFDLQYILFGFFDGSVTVVNEEESGVRKETVLSLTLLGKRRKGAIEMLTSVY